MKIVSKFRTIGFALAIGLFTFACNQETQNETNAEVDEAQKRFRSLHHCRCAAFGEGRRQAGQVPARGPEPLCGDGALGQGQPFKVETVYVSKPRSERPGAMAADRPPVLINALKSPRDTRIAGAKAPALGTLDGLDGYHRPCPWP